MSVVNIFLWKKDCFFFLINRQKTFQNVTSHQNLLVTGSPKVSYQCKGRNSFQLAKLKHIVLNIVTIFGRLFETKIGP